MSNTTLSLARVHGPVEDLEDLVTFDVIGEAYATRDDSLYRASRVQFYDPRDVWVQLIHQTRDGDSTDETSDLWVTLRTLRTGVAEYGPVGDAILRAVVASREAWVA